MYIHDENAPTKNLRVPAMPDDADPVDIPESSVKQVTREVGSALIDHCPSITEHEPDEDD